jgi:hypothetical protein
MQTNYDVGEFNFFCEKFELAKSFFEKVIAMMKDEKAKKHGPFENIASLKKLELLINACNSIIEARSGKEKTTTKGLQQELEVTKKQIMELLTTQQPKNIPGLSSMTLDASEAVKTLEKKIVDCLIRDNVSDELSIEYRKSLAYELGSYIHLKLKILACNAIKELKMSLNKDNFCLSDPWMYSNANVAIYTIINAQKTVDLIHSSSKSSQSTFIELLKSFVRQLCEKHNSALVWAYLITHGILCKSAIDENRSIICRVWRSRHFGKTC